MRAKKARALRKIALDRNDYRALKRAANADMGQHPNHLAVRVRKPKKAIPPTWPRSLDQGRQSRPMIVRHPARHYYAGSSEDFKARARCDFNARPKWQCDAIALTGK